MTSKQKNQNLAIEELPLLLMQQDEIVEKPLCNKPPDVSIDEPVDLFKTAVSEGLSSYTRMKINAIPLTALTAIRHRAHKAGKAEEKRLRKEKEKEIRIMPKFHYLMKLAAAYDQHPGFSAVQQELKSLREINKSFSEELAKMNASLKECISVVANATAKVSSQEQQIAKLDEWLRKSPKIPALQE